MELKTQGWTEHFHKIFQTLKASAYGNTVIFVSRTVIIIGNPYCTTILIEVNIYGYQWNKVNNLLGLTDKAWNILKLRLK